MKNSADWTIGIPTYNRRYFLGEAICSAERQTVKPAQIIVTDNCSSDGSQNVRPRDRSIDFVYKRHSKPVSAIENFKASLLLCKTEYFSWLQDDDYIFPQMGEKLLDALIDMPDANAAIAYAFCSKDINRIRFLQVNVWGPPPFKMHFEAGSSFVVPHCCLFPWLVGFWPGFAPIAIFRTKQLLEAFEQLPSLENYSTLFFEKYLIGSLNARGQILYVPSVLGVLRQHGDNFSSSQKISNYSCKDIETAYIGLMAFLASAMPADATSVKEFFVKHVSYFEESELRESIEICLKYKHEFADFVMSIICEKHQTLVDSIAKLAMRESSISPGTLRIKKILKILLPPFLGTLLQRSRKYIYR